MTTILIVDDHATFRALARAMLEAEGFIVVGEASDAVAGLAAVEALRPQVALVDVGLPGVDGIELSHRLSRGDARRDPGSRPAVVLTSSREASAYHGRLDGAPAAGFLAKDELSGRAIRALVERATAAPAARSAADPRSLDGTSVRR